LPPPAEAVARLRWLAPAADSLAALGRPPTPDTWPALRADPGAVLLLLRQPAASLPPFASSAPFPDTLLDDPVLLDEARRYLELPPAGPFMGFVDWRQPAVRPVYRASVAIAHAARQLALRGGGAHPEQAWVCGLLAPLGWLAVSAVDPPAVAACLADPAFRHDPAGTQQRCWGLDHAGLARRLARRWRLPEWLAGVLAHLGLPDGHARRLGADPVLLALTRRAVSQARGQGLDLGLIDPAASPEDEPADVGAALPAGVELLRWQDPHDLPLLRDLLAAEADNRRLRDAALHRRLEAEADALHRTLQEQARGEAERLQANKLLALAEFAAGAGHEINNPLAVISGQAQYLLAHKGDWFANDAEGAVPRALQAIVAQTRRIHGVLRDMMQFARPAPPRPAWVDLPTLLGEVAAALGELAAQRRVRLEVAAGVDRLAVHVDAEQVRTVLSCLLRNAVEAAPADGWARLVLGEPGRACVEVAVEDSGPGPADSQRAALFDPFYSGRTAGRGRGLGLPVAWRLARQQGGDVRLEPARPSRPTRFVLTLPLGEARHGERASPNQGAATPGGAVAEPLHDAGGPVRGERPAA
jgi:signal transduction histidine kinase